MIVYSSRRLKHDFQTWVNLVTIHLSQVTALYLKNRLRKKP